MGSMWFPDTEYTEPVFGLSLFQKSTCLDYVFNPKVVIVIWSEDSFVACLYNYILVLKTQLYNELNSLGILQLFLTVFIGLMITAEQDLVGHETLTSHVATGEHRI